MSKHHFSQDNFLVPLGLLTFTSCLTVLPCPAQAADETPLASNPEAASKAAIYHQVLIDTGTTSDKTNQDFPQARVINSQNNLFTSVLTTDTPREQVTFASGRTALIPQPLLPTLGEGEQVFQVPVSGLGEGEQAFQVPVSGLGEGEQVFQVPLPGLGEGFRVRADNANTLSTPLADVPTIDPSQDLPPIQPVLPPERPSETQLEPQTPSPTPSPEEVFQSPPPTPLSPEPVPGEIPETIRVQRFEFEGNTVISDEELAEATASYLNRDLTFAEVFEVRNAVTEAYRQRGYVTSGAIIPADQVFQIEEGVVRVQVVEGGLEAIEVRGTRKLDPEYIRSRIALAAGTPVNQSRLIEALQLLQLDPLIANVSAELAGGTKPGTSLLIVEVEEAKTFRVDLALNNNRSPSIGTMERRVEVTEANLRGKGDRITGGYSNTSGSHTFDANYTLPLNPRNGTLNVSASVTFSGVVESPFDRIDIDANSRYFEIGYRQPLSQSLNEEFAIGVRATNQSSRVTIFDIPVRLSEGADEDGRTTVTALRFFQEWVRRNNQQVFAARSQFSLGLGVLGATTNDDAPDSRFLSWRGQVQWVRLFAPDTLLILRGDVQLATQTLLGLEQIGMGGQDTVRGYRQNIFLTDNGALASAEFRFPIWRFQNGLLQLAPFIDVGAAFNSSGSPRPEPDPNILASIGLGLRFRLGNNLTARLDWGIPIINVDLAFDEKETLQENGIYFGINYRIF